MSQENQSEEIDLMQLFGIIREFFRKFLKLILSVITFYKKKIILFAILGLIGGGLGFFLDQYQDKKDSYEQEVIIEPKYDSVEYIYDFIDNISGNLGDVTFIKTLGLEIKDVENIGRINLEPVIRPVDVLSELNEQYGDKESFIEGYNEKLLKEKKYRNLYKQHKLKINFQNGNSDNMEITNAILKYLKSNDYYKEVADLKLKQTNASLNQNKKSLQFINEYLINLSNNPSQSNEKFVFATESETPTISSLLKRKEDLVEKIHLEEEKLVLDKEIFTIIVYGNIISKRKVLLRRMIFMVPLLLVSFVSIVYFLRYLSKVVNDFVDNEQF